MYTVGRRGMCSCVSVAYGVDGHRSRISDQPLCRAKTSCSWSERQAFDGPQIQAHHKNPKTCPNNGLTQRMHILLASCCAASSPRTLPSFSEVALSRAWVRRMFVMTSETLSTACQGLMQQCVLGQPGKCGIPIHESVCRSS